jgi:peptidoglycan/LPS O-acetylase OafA/YrhL
MTRPANKLGYRPELDGVRAFAVLAVLLFHLADISPRLNSIARGGFLGVDVFFVLSGMLITDLLIADRDRRRAEALRSFYIRRARRLLPAVATMLVCAFVYFQIEYHAAKQLIRGLGSLVVFVTVDHRDGHQYPNAITHVWTLVVEWEYYLVWPLVLLFLLSRITRTRTLGWATLGSAAAVGVTAAAVYNLNGHDWTTPYFVAWLRFDELLVGCAVALLAATTSLSPPGWLRTIAPIVVLLPIARCTTSSAYLYDGGGFLLVLATAVIVWPTDQPWWGSRVLANSALVWVGQLSYSIYLWSIPVITEVHRRGAAWRAGVQVAVSVVLTFALSAASYYLIERRFRMPSRRAAGAETDPVLPARDPEADQLRPADQPTFGVNETG